MFLIAVVFMMLSSIHAQTTLNPGDLVIVTANQDGADNFDFIPLVDLQAGTVIKFTDNGYNASNALTSSEGTITWTASTAVSKGTVVSFSGTASGDWATSGSYSLSSSGDNLLVYQGTSTAPSFIYGIGWGKTNVWTYSGSNDSNIPAALSVANKTIVTLGTLDDYQYNGPTTGTAAQLLAMVAYASYWNSSDATAYSAYASTFTITATESCTAPYALTATGVTSSSANLGWSTFGTETAWNVEYGVTGFTQGTGTTVSGVTNPYTLNGLTQNTTYQYYAQADCGGSTSTWAGPFSFTTPYSCPKPTVPTVANITANSADLGWTNGGTETAWIVYYKEATATDYTEITGVTTNPYHITGLAQTTNYIFKVKANCAVSDTSFVSATKTFTTIQIPATIPYAEGFETWPNNWTVVNGTETNKWAVGTAVANTGTQSAYVSNDNGTTNAYTHTASLVHMYRDITFPAGSNPFNLKFSWKGQGESGYDYLRVFLLPITTTPVAGTALTDSLGTYALQAGWQTVNKTLSNATYANQTWRLVFSWKNDGSGGDQPPIAIDDIAITELLCASPTALTATSITATGATLGWTAGGTETAWNIEYGVTGFTQGTGTTVTGVTNPYILNGLTQNTTYQYYVKADCGGSGLSTWAGPFSFTTPYSCPKPTVPTVANITANSADLGWTNGGTETAWIVYYKEATATDYTEITGVTTNPYHITGLAQATNYIFKVKANCSVSDTSFVSATKTFTTIQIPATIPYAEGFETWPNNWTVVNGTETNKWAVGTAVANTGTQSAYVSNDNGTTNAYTHTASLVHMYRDITFPAGSNSFNLKFSWKGQGESGYDYLRVFLLPITTTPVAGTALTDSLGTYALQAGWQTVNKTLSNATYANQTWRLVFSWKNDGGGGVQPPIAIDDIAITELLCAPPTALTATSITATGATLGWTASGTETAWNIEYGVTGFTQGTGTTVTGVTNPYILNGLTQNTTYQYYVKADCGGSGLSTWAGPFSFTTPYSCPKPTVPTVANITANSADLGWTNGGTETAWIVYYKEATATDYTEITGVTTNPYHITGLAQATNYIFKVKANCSVSDTSFVSATKTFTTPCNAISTLPWTEGFEAGYTDAAAIAGCWSQESTTGTAVWNANSTATTYNRTPRTGTFNATLYYSNEDWLFYPFSLTAGTSYTFEMYARQDGSTTTNANITVAYGVNAAAASMTNTIIASTGLTSGNYQLLSGAFTPTTTGTYYIGIKGYINSTPWYISIDDIKLDLTPACVAPTALTATSVTAAGATLGWTAGGTETSWNIEYGVTGFTQGTGTTVTGVTNPYILNGLTQNTTYQYYVKADCGGSGLSTWAGPFSFTTPYSCPKPTVPTVANITANSADLGWTNGGTETAWIVYYKEATATDYTEITGVTTNPYHITGLAQATNYIFKVKANCSVSDTSFVSATKTFTTIQIPATIPYAEGFETWPNNWTVVNGTETNKWAVGTAVANTGTQSAYVSNDNGTTNAYTLTSTSIVHMYRDITFPAGTNPFNLKFNWKGSGEGTSTLYDYLRVSIVPTTTVPVAGTALATGLIGTYNLQSGWQIVNASLANATYANQTWRLVFTWNNDGSDGTQPPIAIDDISITELLCASPTALTATSITATGATLGWTAGGTETAWNIEYGVTGFTQGTGTTVTGVTNPYILSGLTQHTTYQFYVKADCGGSNGLSTWAGPFSFTTPYSCPRPTVPTVANITTISADLGWTAGGTETSWIVYYKTATATDYTVITGVTTNPYTLNGLTSATNYIFKVKADCSASDTSVVSATKTFTTACDIVNVFPYVENFEATTLPTCWSETRTPSSSYGWESYVTGYENRGLRFDSYVNATGNISILKSPVLNITSLATAQAEFWWKNPTGGNFKVVLSTDGGATFPNTLVNNLTGQTNWTLQTIDLTSYIATGSNVVIGFEGTSNYGSNDAYIYLDKLTIGAIPTCLTPTALTATGITTTTAGLTWTSIAPNFKIRYRTIGATNWTFVTSNTPSVSLNGLNSASNYEVQVMAICSATDSSAWTSSCLFTTVCDIITVFPYIQNFNDVTLPELPICFSQNDANADGDKWITYDGYGVADSKCAGIYTDYNDGDNNDYLILPQMTLTGNQQLRFSVRARSTDEPNDYKVVISTTDNSPASFTTDLQPLTVVSSTTMTEISPIDLSAYTGNVWIAIQVPSGGLDGYYLYVDDIKVEAIPTCIVPTAVTASNATVNSADIAWTSTAPNFKIRYRTVGATDWTVTTATASPTTLNGLAHSSNYEAQVMAVCTAIDSSEWSNIVNFATLCDVFTVPFLQNFNVLPFAPNCWSMSQDTLNSTIDLSGTTSSWISDNYLNVDNGPLSAKLNIYGSSKDSWLITPQINLGTSANKLEFDLAATEFGEETDPVGTRLDDKFAVVISTDGGTTWSQANVLRLWDNAGSTYVYNDINTTPQHITIDLSAYSGVVKLAFYGESFVSGNGDNDLFVDNVAVNPILAPCDVPTALTATNVTQTTADLGWTSTAANFNVRYRVVGATAWMTSTSTTTTLPLTALTANTQYEFQVQAVCSAIVGDTSDWAAVANFTTAENVPTCDAPTALAVSAISDAGATLNWTAGGTETAWNIRYKKVADATYTNVSNTTTKPYILTALQSSTAYVWNVQAVCSSTLTSAWSADKTFNTTVGIENNSLSGLSVYSFENKVNVINNGNILVKEVVIYDMIGQEVGKYAISSTDNILINTNLVIGNYMVKVITTSQVGTYKLFIK